MAGTDGTRLELNWPNKDKFLLSPKDANDKPVWVERTHPAASEVRLVDWTGSCGSVDETDPVRDNLLFTGDSLDVLRILAEHPEFRREYRGKIKCVYIDPPFNTGQTFKHYDDWMEHSTWLSFMRDRLLLIRELLTPDGLVWVHLDNYEVHRMRCLMDEIFGAGTFINTVVWQRTTAKSSARRGMGTMYDNLLVYGRSDVSRLNGVITAYSADYLQSKYGKSDHRGRFRLDNLTAPGVRSGDSGQAWGGHDPGSKNRHWAAPKIEGLLDAEWPLLTTRRRLDALLEHGYIQPAAKVGSAPQFKRYLSEAGGVALGDLWTDLTVINSQAKERTRYDTQKPESLLERVVLMSSEPGDVVLDVFGGSGTTAGVAQKTGRRWLMAEVLPATVDGFSHPRLQRIVEGIDSDGGVPLPLEPSTSGFRSIKVGPSMYEVAESGMVLLADWATNGRFSRAVAVQLDFDFDVDGKPFCGHRGRMRLAVLDGAVGPEEVRTLVAALGDNERMTVVAKIVLPGTEEMLTSLLKGSRIRKAPRDVLADGTRRSRRREPAR